MSSFVHLTNLIDWSCWLTLSMVLRYPDKSLIMMPVIDIEFKW